MRTFFTLLLRCIGGELPDPEKPGFGMPNAGSRGGRGFFRLERSGERVNDSTVEPFDTLVIVVDIDATLPPLRIPL